MKSIKGKYVGNIEDFRKKTDMNEDKLKIIIKQLEKETENMNEFEKETYYRIHLMPYFSSGVLMSDTAGYEDWKAGRKGKWITVKGSHIYVIEGKTPKQALLEKIKTLEKPTLSLTKEQKKVQEKKKKKELKKITARRTLSPEEKQRREIEARAKKLKRPKELSEREKAIQKLIEETGYERKRAEAIIDKKIDKKEEIKKVKAIYISGIYRGATRADLKEDLTYDFINKNEFNDITLDFYEEKEDFTVLHGPITRAGPFEYEKNGHKVIYYKDWDNIKEVHKEHDYFPLKATIEIGAHHAVIQGYATNWKPNEKTEQMFADVVLFKNIADLTDLLNPEGGYQVSIGFKDRIENGIQYIEYIDHLAMSLTNKDTGRCLTAGGKSCYVAQKEVNN